ncbi:MAG: nucleotidyltransferase domain-containing protein [Candidatus Aminicenantes bacterium]|nr:nucleotidyltransferase domain-containing protein [Candidatus Aminicenantes bacterium]
MINKDEELSRLVNIIVKKIFPQKILLFGSRAAGTAGEKSDYDIFILVKKCVSTRKIEKELYYLMAKAGIGIPVDLIVETEEKFEKLKGNHYLVYNQVSKYGKTIYEKDTPVPAVA